MKNRTTCNLLRFFVIVLTTLSFCATNVVAQSISRQVIGITGGSTEYNNIKISWTAGETFIGEAASTDGETITTIGFQQANLSILPPASVEKILINISPNPTPDLLNVYLLDPAQENVQISMLNVQGQVLVPNQILNPWKNEIDLTQFPSGTYFLKVINKLSETSQTYKIIKTK